MRIFIHDVSQAYLQIKDKLSRQVFVQSKMKNLKLFGLYKGNVFELILLLYGLCDAKDYCGHTIGDHLLKDLGMTPLTTDAALYVKIGKNGLERVCGMYHHDCDNIRSVINHFRNYQN